MSEKRKQTYMVGLSLIVTGLILLGSLFIILPYLLNLPPEDFHYYNNIHFVMLIFACVTILAGQCLVLYAKHPYYDYKWGNYKISHRYYYNWCCIGSFKCIYIPFYYSTNRISVYDLDDSLSCYLFYIILFL